MNWTAMDATAAQHRHLARRAIGKAQDVIERLLKARKPPLKVTAEQAAALCEVEYWLKEALK